MELSSVARSVIAAATPELYYRAVELLCDSEAIG